ncbi:MAG: M20/M25/M40 family metallo-hydrolase [Dehalococcoidia bacterium]|jgi:acetylornithine deacetylase/succinyl-diaminopimelate desuccinylase-like protein
MDLADILAHLSVPRPNHSEALGETAAYIKALLSSWGVPFFVQEFTLHPYMQLLLGITVLLLAILLFIFVFKRKPLAALITALAIPLVLILEFELFVPVVTALVAKGGENIIVNFTVPNPARELVFAAHYDSKTDFWDHIQRSKIYAFIPLAVIIGLAVSIFTFFVKRYAALRKKAVTVVALVLAAAVVVYWGLIFLGFGGYIFIPPDRQSFGSVDDGGSVAALLALSKDIHDGNVDIGNSNITIILTSGEEVSLQGSHAYILERFGKGNKPAVPISLVNLELAGQNGTMVYWKKDGQFLIFYAADAGLADRLGAAWKEVAGTEMESRPAITDDAQRFMAAGIPAITVGNSGLPGLGEGSFHSTADNPERLNQDNLKLVIKALENYIEGYNNY